MLLENRRIKPVVWVLIQLVHPEGGYRRQACVPGHAGWIYKVHIPGDLLPKGQGLGEQSSKLSLPVPELGKPGVRKLPFPLLGSSQVVRLRHPDPEDGSPKRRALILLEDLPHQLCAAQAGHSGRREDRQ
jgi:hypothetical protein